MKPKTKCDRNLSLLRDRNQRQLEKYKQGLDVKAQIA